MILPLSLMIRPRGSLVILHNTASKCGDVIERVTPDTLANCPPNCMICDTGFGGEPYPDLLPIYEQMYGITLDA